MSGLYNDWSGLGGLDLSQHFEIESFTWHGHNLLILLLYEQYYANLTPSCVENAIIISPGREDKMYHLLSMNCSPEMKLDDVSNLQV